MTVKELYDFLGELMEKRKSIAHMSVELWNPYDEDDSLNWNGTHNTSPINKHSIHVMGYYNGETWDESTDSYEYLEIQASN